MLDFMYKKLFFLMLILLSCASFAVDVDAVLRNADLPKLINSDMVLNLHAQLKDPTKHTHLVSRFNDFVALSSLSNYNTIITEFNAKQEMLHTQTVESPWIGVMLFKPKVSDKLMTLQAGYEQVQQCMANQGIDDITGRAITRVTIYRALQSRNIIYDYLFDLSNYYPLQSWDVCQEVLFVPKTGECSLGMLTLCHFNVVNK